MDEARRFLRQLTPGVVFAAEVALLIALANPAVFMAAWAAIRANAAVVAGAGLLGSPLLGILLSSLHHALLGTELYQTDLGMRPDHRTLVTKIAQRRQFPTLANYRFKLAEVSGKDSMGHDDALNTGEAATFTTAFWHERVDSNTILKAADPRNNSITDIMHGLCASFVGAICALGFGVAVFVLSVLLPVHATKCAANPRMWVNWSVPILLACALFAVAASVLVVRIKDIGFAKGTACRIGGALAVGVGSFGLAYALGDHLGLHKLLSARPEMALVAVVVIAICAVVPLCPTKTPSDTSPTKTPNGKRHWVCDIACAALVGIGVGLLVHWSPSATAGTSVIELVSVGLCLVVVHHWVARRLVREHEHLLFTWLSDAMELERTQPSTVPDGATIPDPPQQPVPLRRAHLASGAAPEWPRNPRSSKG